MGSVRNRFGVPDVKSQGLNPLEGDELVSGLDLNSGLPCEIPASALSSDTSGHPDKVPVLAQHAESEASFDQERFT